ncbi:MAG: hypothetical protein ACOC44_20585 [Promethearchaeia archaeon]
MSFNLKFSLEAPQNVLAGIAKSPQQLLELTKGFSDEDLNLQFSPSSVR